MRLVLVAFCLLLPFQVMAKPIQSNGNAFGHLINGSIETQGLTTLDLQQLPPGIAKKLKSVEVTTVQGPSLTSNTLSSVMTASSASVPAPGSLLLLASGLLGAAFLRRKAT